jgi:hypothetical protein
MNPVIKQKTCERFSELLVETVKSRVTGSSYERVYERPSNKFFVGTLCTQNEKGDRSIQTKISPFSMGLEFLIKKKDVGKGAIKIKPSSYFYYRVLPTYEEQKVHAAEELGLSREALDKEISSKSKLGIRIRKVFKKISLPNVELSADLKDFGKKGIISDNYKAIEELINTVKADPKRFKKRIGKIEQFQKIPLESLKSEDAFNEVISSWGTKEIEPKWSFDIVYKISDYSNDLAKITVMMLNSCTSKSSDTSENFLFETKLDVKVEGASIQDFIIDYLKDDYKYDGNVKGNGINCSVIMIDRHHVITEQMPVFRQKKFKSNPDIKPKFDALSSNPLKELKGISASMKSKLLDFKSMGQNIESDMGKLNFENDINQFEKEIERFDTGISVLEKYPNVMKAFKLMNETFSKSSAKSFDSWRLFQIVFIVMLLPDVAAEEYEEIKNYRDIVDVIYFPTGGGKTEAYLGIVIFSAFFDRIRGKHAGVTAITKFPLRLLSLQQLQRIADLFAKAELVRRAEPAISKKPNEPFSVGYYVGENNTPNVLVDKNEMYGKNIDYLTQIANSPEEAEKYLIVARCPFCDEYSVKIEPDFEHTRLLHRCTNTKCEEDVLPVYITDVEIYRYLPTFIVSTLDKMAICGWQRNFRNLYGQVKLKCPKHGYTSSEYCVEKNCNVKHDEFEKVEIYDPTPSLLIQDEMHLVRESLGTLDSHYETFLSHYQRSLTGGKKEAKVITATATISEYELQTRHLYMKKAMQFPSSGPSKTETFYAYEDNNELNRLMVGVLPHNKTIIYSVLDILQSISETVQHWKNHPDDLASKLDASKQEIDEMLEYYSTILSYNLAKRRGDRIKHSVSVMVNQGLAKQGFNEIRQKSLTGDISFSEIREILNVLESGKENDIDLIIATSMISHGVDINKLNLMIFTEMPRNTAEYIQALSRVGRAIPGIVFVVMNPTMERDQSYYKYFEKFHEFKDMLVEAVPINRWAKFSINRTLPGIFTATILNYFDLKVKGVHKGIYLPSSFNQAQTNGTLKDDEILNFILESYKADQDQLGINFDKIIKTKVSKYIADITGSIRKNFINDAIHDKPMFSLRDVESLIEISPTNESYQAISGMTASRTRDYHEKR